MDNAGIAEINATLSTSKTQNCVIRKASYRVICPPTQQRQEETEAERGEETEEEREEERAGEREEEREQEREQEREEQRE